MTFVAMWRRLAFLASECRPCGKPKKHQQSVAKRRKAARGKSRKAGFALDRATLLIMHVHGELVRDVLTAPSVIDFK
jgi:hypothetical protein